MNGVETSSSTPLFSGQAPRSEERHVAGSETNISLGYLRAFIIVLVLVHHTAVAYFLPVAPPPASSLIEYLHSIRAISPVIDGAHSWFFFLVAFFNDRFFMPLLFFLSGLFVWGSLQKKGRWVFFRDRLIRLGIPFVVMVILAPFTYYTSYLQTRGSTELTSFWQQWTSLGDWPTGPAWFLWLLLAFDTVVTVVSVPIRNKSSFFDKIPSSVVRRPASLFGLIVVLSAIAYIPMITVFDPNFSWWHWGPFSFQTSRVFLYLVYFLIGIVIGARGIQTTCLVANSTLARRWFLWVTVALAAFVATFVATFAKAMWALIGFSFLLFCAATSFAFLAVFLRFAGKRESAFDSLFQNSFGIYVIHYVVVSWILYGMLRISLPALSKGSIVFALTLAICWSLIALVRRIPGVARVI